MSSKEAPPPKQATTPATAAAAAAANSIPPAAVAAAETSTAASVPPSSPSHLILAVRNLFKFLADDEFESEVQIERKRRASLKSASPKDDVQNNSKSNKRKAPPVAAAEAVATAAVQNNEDDDSPIMAKDLPSSSNKKRKAAPAAQPHPPPFYYHHHAVAAAAAAPFSQNRAPLHPMAMAYPMQPSYNMATTYRSFPPPSPLAATRNEHTATAAAAAAKQPPPSPPKDDDGQKLAAKKKSPKKGKKTKGGDDPAAAAAATTKKKTPGVTQAIFEAKLLEVQAFQAQSGHLNVSNMAVATKDEKLAVLYRWICRQKSEWTKFLRGQPSTQTLEKIQMLIDVGLGTSGGPMSNKKELDEQSWNDSFQQLVKFKNEHGHMDLSKHRKDQSAEIIKLATWVGTQKGNFLRRKHRAETGEKKRGGCMTDSQLERLASIGFRFTNKNLTFEERFQHMLEYKAIHGHTRVPVYFRGYSNLGRWVTSIKDAYHNKSILPERVEKLNEIGFDWSLRSGPNSQKEHRM